MANNKQCTYPNCDSCNDIFSIPACMLMDAGIDLDDRIIIIPYDGYVLIRQDDKHEDIFTHNNININNTRYNNTRRNTTETSRNFKGNDFLKIAMELDDI